MIERPTLRDLGAMAFGGPARYLQAPGLLACLDEILDGYGQRPTVLLDAALFELLHTTIRQGLGPLAQSTTFVPFRGECTSVAIESAAEAARASRSELIVGVGGGKAIDTAKGVRHALDLPLAVIPSVASNDSPTSRLIVVYDDQHVLTEVRLMQRSPELVLVDTAVIARAPVRFLRAGIGDAISKRFEVQEAVAAGGANFFGGRGGQVALAIAGHCHRTLLADAEAALRACQRGVPDAALERVVEACVLGSGLGFESGGLSIAHAMLRGFSRVPALAASLHGEQVAVGLLVQLHLTEGAQETLATLADFYRVVGLPTDLFGLGFKGRVEDVLEHIVEHTVATAPYLANFSRRVTAGELSQALARLHQAP